MTLPPFAQMSCRSGFFCWDRCGRDSPFPRRERSLACRCLARFSPRFTVPNVEPAVLEPGWAVKNGAVDGEGGGSATAAGPGAAGATECPMPGGPLRDVQSLQTAPQPTKGPPTLRSGWNDLSEAHQEPRAALSLCPARALWCPDLVVTPAPGAGRGVAQMGRPLGLGHVWHEAGIGGSGSVGVGRPGWGACGTRTACAVYGKCRRRSCGSGELSVNARPPVVTVTQ